MGGKTSKTAIAALVLGLLGNLIWAPQLTLAKERSEGTVSKQILGLAGKDALEHFPLPPFNVSVIRNGKVERILTIAVTMEAKGEVNMTKIMDHRYQIHDAFLRDIHGVASFQRADGRAIDPEVVKARLMVISDRLLGEGTVENVLVVSIFDRSMS